MPLSRDDVARTYKALLGLDAGEDAITHWTKHQDDFWEFLEKFRNTPSVAWSLSKDVHYPAALSFQDFMFCRKHIVPVQPEPGFIISEFGIRTRTNYAEKWASKDGTLARLEFGSCFEFDAIEWFALLKAIERADHRFSVAELGCGWGPWMTAGSVLARRKGKKEISSIGVEGDETRRSFIDQHRADNSISDIPRTVFAGVVAPKSGTALFPKPDDSTKDMGIAAIYSDQQAGVIKDYRGADHKHISYEAFSVEDILENTDRVDFMHIDIQGGELDVVPAAANIISKKCRHLLIATHSREIEWKVAAALMPHGWILEKERPCEMHYGDDWARSGRDWPLVKRDGSQFWRHPDVLP